MKTFYVDFTTEQGNYLQRLGLEVDSKLFLIDRMFVNHMNDTDTILFDSVPFKHYHKEYEKAFNSYELAKQEFKTTYLMPLVKQTLNLGETDEIQFSWTIDDFTSGKCKITIMDK